MSALLSRKERGEEQNSRRRPQGTTHLCVLHLFSAHANRDARGQTGTPGTPGTEGEGGEKVEELERWSDRERDMRVTLREGGREERRNDGSWKRWKDVEREREEVE